MKAVVYHGANDLRLEERQIPRIKADEALLRVFSACICGTDLRILHGNHRLYPPGTIRIPGHEVVGELVEVGRLVTGVQTGQRLFVAPNMGCGHCPECVSGNNNLCKEYMAIGLTIDGAFAEYMVIPAETIRQGNLIPVNRQSDPAVTALIEAFACVLRGQDAVNVHAGDNVLVIGAGPIGVMHAILAGFRGAGKVMVSELIPERAQQAKSLGIENVICPPQEDLAQAVAEISSGSGADVVIVAAPSAQAQEEACRLAAIRGRINFFGGLPKDRPTISLDSNLVHYKEIVLTGTTACSTNDCWRAAKILISGRVDLSKIITDRYSLDQYNEAFSTAEDRKALKVSFDINSF
jgi:L-iditol 2-dehydrogenase